MKAFDCIPLFLVLAILPTNGANTSATDTRSADSLGYTPLHRAALANDSKEVERLLAAGASARATNQAGATPLHYGTGSERIVRLLLLAGADPNVHSVANITPLHSAAARPESAAVVRLLLEAGAEVDAPRPVFPEGSVTALTLAALAGDEQTVKVLLDHRASPGGANGFTPVAAAAFAGHEKILKTLLARGGNVNCDDGFAGNALNNVFYAGHFSIAPFLIEHGSDLHQTSTFGERVPPMVWSAYNESGNVALARLLLSHGLDINEPTGSGSTALDWAMKRGETPLTAYLREHGAKNGTKPLKKKSIPQNAVPEGPAARRQAVLDSAQRAINILQRSSDGFLANGFVKESACVSCHQQTIPAVAFGMARERGLRLDESSLIRQLKAQHASWSKTRDKAYEMYEPQPASPANLGYGLRGLHALRYEPDELTAAMVWYLAASQLPDGSWPDYDRRPPLEGGQIIGTALTISALRLYPQPVNTVSVDRSIARGRRWLERANADDMNKQVFRMLGLGWAGASPSELRLEVRALKALQRPDGGWAPLPELGSDAWATGETLFALHEAGGMSTDDPVYQRGVSFLLRTQFPDGSWWVASRTWPFQPHFDSQFPHGKDQWISAGGTAWASIALLNTIEPSIPAQSLPTAQTLMTTAIKLSGDEKQATSSAGASVNSDQRVLFARDIQPLLERSCVNCHSGDKPKGRFRLDAREELFKAGQSGEAAVVPGDSGSSQLLRLASDAVEDLEMPPKNRRTKYPPLTPPEIARVREWIDQGAN